MDYAWARVGLTNYSCELVNTGVNAVRPRSAT